MFGLVNMIKNYRLRRNCNANNRLTIIQNKEEKIQMIETKYKPRYCTYILNRLWQPADLEKRDTLDFDGCVKSNVLVFILILIHC